MTDIPSTSVSEFWDHEGTLSIVVQGRLDADNLIETVNHCTHWRLMFPNATIVLAISTTELFHSVDTRGGTPKLAARQRYADSLAIATAAARLARSCTSIAMSPGATPLPAFKLFSKSENNCNAQIAAAQAGLAEVSSVYTLRVRSDLVFNSRRFIDYYLGRVSSPRISSRILQERVLISSLFTLNPYSFQQMPYHFSDWFHFGLSGDVRSLWQVPEMSYGDSIHYVTHEYAPHSTADDALCIPRLAVEQHIAFNALRSMLPLGNLDYHNDLSCRDESLDVLMSNFVVVSPRDVDCIIPKYQDWIADAKVTQSCIEGADWDAMAAHNSKKNDYLIDKIKELANRAGAPFPRVYRGWQIYTGIGTRSRHALVAKDANGILAHGPYDTLPQGSYVATVDFPFLRGSGSITAQVTLDRGVVKLASAALETAGLGSASLEIFFSIDESVGKFFEVVVTIENVSDIILDQIIVLRT